MKIWKVAAAAAVLAFSLGECALAAEAPAEKGIAVTVNGKEAGTAAVMVPLRQAAEALGYKVSWNYGLMALNNGTVQVNLALRRDRYEIAVKEKGKWSAPHVRSFGAAPYAYGGTTYVPLALFEVMAGVKGNVTAAGTVSISTGGAPSAAETANPWTDRATIQDGVNAVGFAVTLPEQPGNLKTLSVRTMEKELIEVTYSGKDEALRFRKGTGLRDVSGDYNRYSQTRQAETNGALVTLKGDKNKVHLATWSKNQYSYAISSEKGLSEKKMLSLVREME